MLFTLPILIGLSLLLAVAIFWIMRWRRNNLGNRFAAAPKKIPVHLAATGIFGLGTLSFLGGAAAMYFGLPSAAYLREIFTGVERELENQNLVAIAAQGPTGIEVDRPEMTADGFTLYTMSDVPRAVVIDMRGNVVHEWELRFSKAWKQPAHIGEPLTDDRFYWFGCHAFANGDLLAVYQAVREGDYGCGLVKLDKDAKLLWSYPAQVHHNIDVTEDGRIFAVVQNLVRAAIPDAPLFPVPYRDDVLIVLSPQGKLLKSVSLINALVKSDFPQTLSQRRNMIDRSEFETRDYLHTNTIKVMTRSLAPQFPFVKEGQVLLSFLSLSMLAVLDIDTERIVWIGHGAWRRQHAADFLDNGHILLYDNSGDPVNTRVLEFSPKTQEIAWSYANENSRPFSTSIVGGAQRLRNGNTLIVDPGRARLFEVTRAKQLAWEFRDPDAASPNHPHNAPWIVYTRRYYADELKFLKDHACRP